MAQPAARFQGRLQSAMRLSGVSTCSLEDPAPAAAAAATAAAAGASCIDVCSPCAMPATPRASGCASCVQRGTDHTGMSEVTGG